MVFRAAAPGVVGELVIVPGDGERVLAMHLLGVRIAFVLSVSVAIVAQRDDLSVRRRNPAEAGAIAVLRVGVLIQIVAEVQDRIEIGTVRQAGVGVEIA